MPDFLKSILIKITSYGWLALLAGLGLVGYAGYAQYKASGDHAYVAQDKLSKLTGKVEGGSEVTVTSKRRRGGSHVSERYFEIEVKPANGEVQKLRLALSVGRSTVESLIDEQITALFDSDDNNIVYDVEMDGKTVLPYETTKARLQAQAESRAESSSSLASMGSFLALALIGAVGMFLNRKLRSSQEVQQA